MSRVRASHGTMLTRAADACIAQRTALQRQLLSRACFCADAGAAPLDAVAADPAVLELRIESFAQAPEGNPLTVCRQPVLVALLKDGSLLIYRAFDAGAGRVSFRRLSLGGAAHSIGLPGNGLPPASPRLARFDALGEGEGFVYRRARPRFCGRERLAGRMDWPVQASHCMLAQCSDCAVLWGRSSGIFVCGERPLWLLAMRGTLMAHPMSVEGAVLGFTPFHNINCPRVRVSLPWTSRVVPLYYHVHAT